MTKKSRQTLLWFGLCNLFGLVFGLFFGYLYGDFLQFLVMTFSISYSIWLLNTLAQTLLLHRMEKFPKERRLLVEILVFFGTTLTGFLVSMSVLSRVFKFDFFFSKSFLSSLGLLLVLYGMIAGLLYSFIFYRELKNREVAAAKLKELAAEAELKALKSQVDPHFLFNTLNSINALVTDNPGLARKMIAHLSGLLRTSLESRDMTLIPLRKELDFARAYLEIEKIRFDKKMAYLERIDNSLLDHPFPSMVLQPLLENAVKHGVSESRLGGAIRLEIKREAGRVQCSVSNTTGSAGSSKQMNPPGIRTGLANISQRLSLLYGEEHNFRYGSSPSGEFEVVLSFPEEAQKPDG